VRADVATTGAILPKLPLLEAGPVDAAVKAVRAPGRRSAAFTAAIRAHASTGRDFGTATGCRALARLRATPTPPGGAGSAPRGGHGRATLNRRRPERRRRDSRGLPHGRPALSRLKRRSVAWPPFGAARNAELLEDEQAGFDSARGRGFAQSLHCFSSSVASSCR
jgi:hypothetical protein